MTLRAAIKRAIPGFTLALSAAAAAPGIANQAPATPVAAPKTDPGTPPVRARARAGSPNVLVWMLDDVGFAQLGCYGGLVSTPNIDRVAWMGLRYSNYHTTPICSASRASFLTGRNSHTVHVGGHMASPRGYPGYDGMIPASAGTLAANLEQAGYVTFALGKWDHIPSSDMSPSGPFTYWPTHQGFDHFYGFFAAENDNWNPNLWRDATPINRPQVPGYHLNQDLADEAISAIDSRSAQAVAAPFLMYWATGTAHAPHHAPAEWIARYRGRFDSGWDVARDQALQREIQEGIVPASTRLAPRPEGMLAWKDLNADERRMYAHEMEVFAASISYADFEFGRILDELQARGELDNTIVVITSDNGASAEGGRNGSYNDIAFVGGHTPDVNENLRWYDQWGGPATLPHYSYGWAVAGNTPFRYFKQTTHEGGTHVPLIVSWPAGIAARGEWRSQFVHVSDLTPTILDAAQVLPAAVVNGVSQSAFDGQSVSYSFVHADEPTHKQAQYFEMYGNKALWSDSWLAVTSHSVTPWAMLTTPKSMDDPWELYNLKQDPGETQNLADRFPDRVTRLATIFQDQAVRFHVDPIGDFPSNLAYMAELKSEEFRRRGGRWIFSGPMARIPEAAAPPVAQRSYTFSVDLDLAKGNETGPIFAIGGAHGGMSFYLKAGKPVFLMRSLTGETSAIESSRSLPPGKSHLTLHVRRTPPSPGSQPETSVEIDADNQALVSKAVAFAPPFLFSIYETFDIGRDDGTAVADDYPANTSLPAQLHNIVFDFNETH